MQGRKRQAYLVGKASQYLEIAAKARKERWSNDKIKKALEPFFKLAPDAKVGSTDLRYEPRPNDITDKLIPAVQNTVRQGVNGAVEAAKRGKEMWDNRSKLWDLLPSK